MRKVLLSTLVFLLSLGVAIKVNNRSINSDREPASVVESSRKDRMDKPRKYLEFHRGIRTREGDAAPGYRAGYKWAELSKARANQAARRRANGRTQSNGVLEWKERGPGNVPGRTRALYNVPGDAANNTWLAGAATGGIWRTTDGGTTWSERSADFPALPISSFAGDDAGTVIYASTGEFVSSVYSAVGNGIFKSTDKGLTWTQLPSTAVGVTNVFAVTTRIIVHPTNANLILATTVPHSLANDETSEIMRSTDGGTTWTKVHEVEGALEQIIASPADFNIQYATQNGVGVWKSEDAGLTWTLYNSGMEPSGRIEVAVSPVDPNRLYASAEGTLAKVDADLYMSTNGGESWDLLDIKFNGANFDFFEGQGFYDNTILADPFDVNLVYFGGVSMFRAKVEDGGTTVDYYEIEEDGTDSFMRLRNFTNIEFAGARLTVGKPNPTIDVELRFGPGISQLAHQFLVPVGQTSGVPAASYTYNGYVEVPFQAWDVTNNRQLMVSFRDQSRNGKFDLLPYDFTGTPATDYMNDSREYLYVHNTNYQPNASTAISVAGGQNVDLVYSIFPALADGATWTPDDLPASELRILYAPINKRNATTVTVADGRDAFGKINRTNQVELDKGVHPDHHFMIPLIQDATEKTYRLLVGNDGGVFVSKVSKTPGITDGDWFFKGFGYNTSQFYGADKRPGADQYIGGTQDNGTRYSSGGVSASASTPYIFAIGGDGFETIWHSKDANRILGSIYYGDLRRSEDFGATFTTATAGLPVGSTNFSFVTKIANSKVYPHRVFIAGRPGVYVSNNFGQSWQLTPIESSWIINTPFYHDVEVSRANPNIVWAGTGMSNTANINLHASVDGGKTFTKTNNYSETTLGYITKLASHPTQPNTAYALFSFSEGPKILRTTDLGETWEDISGFGNNSVSSNGFPDVAVYCLYVRNDDPNIIWAGTEIGIVESLDNGQTWAMVDGFPNVSVWDMKGQDDQVVIATHGRGIWTATVDGEQVSSLEAPQLIAHGNAPDNSYVLRMNSLHDFDSVQFYFNNQYGGAIEDFTTGVYDITATLPAGNWNLYVVGYKDGIPTQSSSSILRKIEIMAKVDTYSTSFSTVSDLAVTSMALGNMTGVDGKVLRTTHPYANDNLYEFLVRKPVKVGAGDALVYIRDIAITEPGVDSIYVEATKNGIDWLQLGAAYDAAFKPSWNAAYNGAQSGTSAMFEIHTRDIKDAFATGDTLLFRFRFRTNSTTNAWGWALRYVGIQEEPPADVVANEDNPLEVKVTMYPNPTQGTLNVEYTLALPADVTLKTVDLGGRALITQQRGLRAAGKHTEAINLSALPAGEYLITIEAGKQRQTQKIILTK